MAVAESESSESAPAADVACPAVELITFCTRDFNQSAYHLHEPAVAIGRISRVHHFEAESTWLPVCRASYPHLLMEPGPDWGQGEFDRISKCKQSARHGWYAWKAWALCQVLEHVSDGTFLLYTDCNADKYPLLADTFSADVRPACAALLEAHGDFFCPTNTHWRHGPMCKRLCLEAMGATTSEYIDALQLQASWFLCRAGDQTRRIAREWLAWCTDPRGLITGAPSPGGEHPGFRCHRHDQAILTTLLLKEHLASRLPTPRPYAEARFFAGVVSELRGQRYDTIDRLVALSRRGERAALATLLEVACAFHAGDEGAQRAAAQQRVEKLSEGLEQSARDHLLARVSEVLAVLVRKHCVPRAR